MKIISLRFHREYFNTVYARIEKVRNLREIKNCIGTFTENHTLSPIRPCVAVNYFNLNNILYYIILISIIFR